MTAALMPRKGWGTSMDIIELRTAPEIRSIVLAAFPGYRKHKAIVSDFRPTNINSYWSGGSRDEYALVHLPTMQRKGLPTSTHPFYEIAARGMVGQQNDDVEVDHVGNVTLKRLPTGFALVCAGTFCGKPATAKVYLSVDNQLPADGAQ